jgi:hypothetical protein
MTNTSELNAHRPWKIVNRRKTRQIMVGNVPVGGDAPVTVQSMTNTLTADVQATIEQIKRMEAVGVDIVRCSCPDEESTAALKEIVKAVSVPVVADIHFHYKRGIEAAQAGAACLRINPGKIGSPDRVAEVVKAAKDYNCSIRIGVNAGSLEQELLEKYGEPCPDAMVESALAHAKILEDHDFRNFKMRQGLRCLSVGRGLSQTIRGLRLSPARRRHRSGWLTHRHCQKLGRHGPFAGRRYRRHHSRFSFGGSRRRSACRLRNTQSLGPAQQGDNRRFMPDVRAQTL